MGTSWSWDVVFTHGSLTAEIDYQEFVSGLVEGRLITRVWTPSGKCLGFSTRPRSGVGPAKVSLSIDAGVPRPTSSRGRRRPPARR